jgi:tetratricopeptide (TPR) repeat protein
MSTELRIFVAMPGTDFGPNAHWKKPDDVLQFLEQLHEEIKLRLKRDVVLVVEKEKRLTGVIHDSMYREAFEADVFIADLTNANANVFFELGVRYALRRRVTVLISQDSAQAPFDVKPLRILQYAQRPDRAAIQDICATIEAGLADVDHCDSPVLQALDLEVVSREQWQRVSGEQVRRRLSRAQSETDIDRRLALLREAVQIDQWSYEARLALIKELARLQRSAEAEDEARAGIRLDPRYAPFHRQLGLVLGKMGRLEAAVEALRVARNLDENAEVLANLGGALRRLTVRGGLTGIDRTALEESIACYARASELQRHDTYSRLNLIRLHLIRASFEPESAAVALRMVESARYLCAFEVAEHPPEPWWRLFDLADALILAGAAAEGLERYQEGIEAVPADHRASVLDSPLQTLKELDQLAPLSDQVRQGVRTALALLERHLADHDR